MKQERKLQGQLKPNRVTNFLDEESLRSAYEDGLKPGSNWKALEISEERKRKTVADRRVVETGNNEWKENCLLKLFQLFERKPRWYVSCNCCAYVVGSKLCVGVLEISTTK